jgi:hypothetical protein
MRLSHKATGEIAISAPGEISVDEG